MMIWRAALIIAIAAVAAGASSSARASQHAPAAVDRSTPAALAPQAVLDRYCMTCHNPRSQAGGFTLASAAVVNPGAEPAMWEKVVRKLRAGVMPPAGRPRPDRQTHDALVAFLEGSLDRVAAERPDPGRSEPLHRLNRAEYRNAVRDVFAVSYDAADLPADDASYGFDNIAAVQRMSPTLMERYLAAARKVSRLAVGASDPVFATTTVTVPPELPQDEWLEGLPLGTRGGARIDHVFPRDGEYSIRVQLATQGSDEELPRFDQPQPLEVSLDGERLTVFTLSPNDPRDGGADRRSTELDWQIRFTAPAGPAVVGLAFLNRTPAMLENLIEPFARPYEGGNNARYATRKGAYVRTVQIAGPYQIGGPGRTPSRERIFTCRPAATAAEEPCARAILSTLARRAYRQPPTARDVDRLLAIYRAGRADGSFELGIEQAVEALLVSPRFLFRVEHDRPGSGSLYRVGDLELASRLSFFLWSSVPDDELIDAAVQGDLAEPAGLERQVRRMLSDRRADALVTNFVAQWLFLRNVAALAPDPRKDPDFDESLRRAFRRETELLAASILRDDRSVLDFLSADYTFLNERLARHYGVANVQGSHFRRVAVADPRRRGLLGHASVLSVTAFPHRTSPVLRGKWVLENLLGTPVPDPPPDVPPLNEAASARDEAALTMRQRIAEHRANPACSSCHSMMDPPGLALENFDFVGRWRDVDEAFVPIDASGVLPDGTAFDGPGGLRAALLQRPEQFVGTFIEKLLTYALGRGLEPTDMPAVRAITRQAAQHDYRASAVILGVVNSLPFQYRRTES